MIVAVKEFTPIYQTHGAWTRDACGKMLATMVDDPGAGNRTTRGSTCRCLGTPSPRRWLQLDTRQSCCIRQIQTSVTVGLGKDESYVILFSTHFLITSMSLCKRRAWPIG